MTQVGTLKELNAATSTEVTYDPVAITGSGLFVPRAGVHYHSTQPGKLAKLQASIFLSGSIGALIEDLAVENPTDSALGSDSAKPSHDLECRNLDLSGWAPVQMNARDYNLTLTDCVIHDALNNGILLARYGGDDHVRAPQPGGFGFKMHGGSIKRTGLAPAPSSGAVHGAYVNWFDSEMLGVDVEDYANSGVTWRFGGGHIGWCDFKPSSRSTASISYFETDPMPGHTLIEACLGIGHVTGANKDIYLDQGTTPNETIVVRQCNGMVVNINANNKGLATWDGILDYPKAGVAFWPGNGQPPPPPPPLTVDVPAAIGELRTGLDNLVSQLHYSVAKAKATHFYKALLELGGTWR